MSAERAYARLVAANPVEDPERDLAALVDLEGSLRTFEGEVMVGDTVSPRPATEPLVRRWLVAAAAFAAVLAVGIPLWLASPGDETDMTGSEPTGVVNAFFDRWNRGDVDAALGLVASDVAVNAGLQDRLDLRGLMLFAAQFDGAMEAECSTLSEQGAVSCAWVWRSAAADSLGVPGLDAARFVVREGMITELSTPNYGIVEQALSNFAREVDPAGFATACTPDGESPRSVYGFPFNSQCGGFLAELEAGFIARLDE